jgi:hypothetical protein
MGSRTGKPDTLKLSLGKIGDMSWGAIASDFKAPFVLTDAAEKLFHTIWKPNTLQFH